MMSRSSRTIARYIVAATAAASAAMTTITPMPSQASDDFEIASTVTLRDTKSSPFSGRVGPVACAPPDAGPFQLELSVYRYGTHTWRFNDISVASESGLVPGFTFDSEPMTLDGVFFTSSAFPIVTDTNETYTLTIVAEALDNDGNVTDTQTISQTQTIIAETSPPAELEVEIKAPNPIVSNRFKVEVPVEVTNPNACPIEDVAVGYGVTYDTGETESRGLQLFIDDLDGYETKAVTIGVRTRSSPQRGVDSFTVDAEASPKVIDHTDQFRSGTSAPHNIESEHGLELTASFGERPLDERARNVVGQGRNAVVEYRMTNKGGDPVRASVSFGNVPISRNADGNIEGDLNRNELLDAGEVFRWIRTLDTHALGTFSLRDTYRATLEDETNALFEGEHTINYIVAATAARLVDTRNTRIVDAAGSVTLAASGAQAGDWIGVNITPIEARANGFGIIHSSDVAAGSTSNVNFGPGTVDPNFAMVQVGSDGNIMFTNSRHGSVHVIIDQLLVLDQDLQQPAADGSVRLADTRVGAGGARLSAGGSMCTSAVGARGGQTIGVNITPVGAVNNGFGTVHSSDRSPGATSNVNFGLGTVDPNFAFVQVGSDGKICFANSIHGPVDVIIDQMVTAPTISFVAPSDSGAIRLLDTRQGDVASPLPPSEVLCTRPFTGTVREVLGINITPINAAQTGFGTVHSSAVTPDWSNVNFGPGTLDPNFTLVEIEPGAGLCFSNSKHGAIDLVLDLQIVALG